MKKFFLFALLAALTPLLVIAQHSITGKVSDPSKKELKGASVTLNNNLFTTQTNQFGEFSISNIKPGSYTIKVSFLGFQTVEKTIYLNSDQELNFTLEPTSILADEIIVRSTRAQENTPTTYHNLSRRDIEKNNLGQDLPYLLNQTPSVTVSSDAGAGVGYTGIRIRGSDASRINVTINGIPYNDSESQGSFWVNMPDFASSVDNIQIQRGVGTSTNGAGAFGASINVQTNVRRDTAYAEINNTYGSFETWKNTINIGTGLLNGKFSIDGRLSRIKSDGYIDNAFSNLKGYFVSGAYYGKKSMLRANVFAGDERTYQAWNGVPEYLLETNRRYNYYTYSDQTDNYKQNHYQLLYSNQLSDKLSLNGALHYTKGRGYYKEFKEDEGLGEYSLPPIVVNGSALDAADLIRKRWLDNDFYGLTYSLNYKPTTALDLTLGGAYNEYTGRHFGEVVWTEFTNDMKQRYYYNDADKNDFNIFGKATLYYNSLSLFADLQYRRIGYSFLGYDRNQNNVQQDVTLNFFNPKFGITYDLNSKSNVYASFAVGNREPNRDDYTESSIESRPKPENLKNVEAGYRYKSGKFNMGINGYAMLYKNQLILTGQINDVGAYLRQNVSDSYRIGAEYDMSVSFNKYVSWGATATISRNKIKNFKEYVDNYNENDEWLGQTTNFYKSTNIAFSPSLITSSELAIRPLKNTSIAWLSKYVSKQYLDNSSSETRKIDPYFVNALRIQYNTSFHRVKNIGLTLMVNNIFNELYETNGYTYYYPNQGKLVYENAYYPQATRNFLLSLSLKF